jgi:hypothetical protein
VKIISALAAIALMKLCTWLYIYDLQIKFEDGCYQPNFGRVMPLEHNHFKGFQFSGLFSAMCAAIALKLCTWLNIYDLRIKFKDGCYQLNFGRVMPLEPGHFKGFYFLDFFPQCVQLLR